MLVVGVIQMTTYLIEHFFALVDEQGMMDAIVMLGDWETRYTNIGENNV